MILHLPQPLAKALWAHADRECPKECVGVLGGRFADGDIYVQALYPLGNIAQRPESEYLADPGHLARALKAMQRDEQLMVGLYHSHPNGPSYPSRTDLRLAEYPVPYLIANLEGRSLHAYLLPENAMVEIQLGTTS